MTSSKSHGKEKEPPTNVTSVYMHVVEDVINNIRADFQSEGIEDGVLNELQALWELKMLQSRAIEGGEIYGGSAAPSNLAAKAGAQPTNPVHDLNVPYEAPEDYEASSAGINFPQRPTQMSNGISLVHPYVPMGPIWSSLVPDSGQEYLVNHKSRNVEINVNETYEPREDEDNGFTHLPITTHASSPLDPPITKDFFTLSTGKRKQEELTAGCISGNYIPQRDGAGDVDLNLAPLVNSSSSHPDVGPRVSWAAQRVAVRSFDCQIWQKENVNADTTIRSLPAAHTCSSDIPQLDGVGDNYDDAVAEEDYNQPGEEETQLANDTPTPKVKAEPADSNGSEPPLNEDDDEEPDDGDEGDEEPKTRHLVLAQFDKVTRSKNKWKCALKDCVMHLNDRDFLHAKATGEFEF